MIRSKGHWLIFHTVAGEAIKPGASYSLNLSSPIVKPMRLKDTALAKPLAQGLVVGVTGSSPKDPMETVSSTLCLLLLFLPSLRSSNIQALGGVCDQAGITLLLGDRGCERSEGQGQAGRSC